jgi:hypothetical protein
MSTRTLALSHSELMTQHQDLGVLPPRLTARQAQQRHGPQITDQTIYTDNGCSVT